MSVTANFAVNRKLTINVTGNGSGTVTAAKGIIYWNLHTGVAYYADSTEETLTAVADTGTTFKGWTGCDSTSGANGIICVVKMTAAKTVNADFSKPSSKKVKNDFNGDGKSDIFWQAGSDGDTSVWFMAGEKYTKAAPSPPSAKGYRFLATGYFNGDGKPDVLWQSTDGKGTVVIWLMNGVAIATNAVVKGAETLPAGYQFKGIGDFDGDGKDDILWQDDNGDVVMWLMNGSDIATNVVVKGAEKLESKYLFRGIGDFNGDGKADVLWQDTATGDVIIWFMDGATATSKEFVPKAKALPVVYQIRGVGDFNGDGKADIVLQDITKTDRGVHVWLMNGLNITSDTTVVVAKPGTWQLKDIGDYNGDGKYDMLWQDTNGDVAVWAMNGISIT
ncbi:FG-GAP repeat-containing protein, partial [Candidatus Magnetobacterium bavaricum]